MHTTNATKVRFHHNGDYSDEVIIVHKETKQEMTVPFEDLKTLVAGYVLAERISMLEGANTHTVLGCSRQLHLITNH